MSSNYKLNQAGLVEFIHKLPTPAILVSKNFENSFEILSLNTAFEKSFKCLERELLGENPVDLFDACFENRLNEGFVDIECMAKLKDGEEVPTYVKISKIDTESEEGLKLILVQDASREYELERELERLHTQSESIFEHRPDFNYTINREGYMTSVNLVGEKLLKYSKSEMLRMHYTEFIHEADIYTTQQKFKKVLESKVVQFEIKLCTKYGEKIIVYITAIPILDGGEVVGVYGNARDITKDREIENQLQESEQRYRSLFENNVDAVVTFDLDGNFAFMNSATEKLMGYSSEELLGRPFLPHIVSEYKEFTLNEFSKALKGKAIQYETAMYNKKKEIVDLHITVIPIILDSQVVGIHCIGKDITMQKNIEKRLSDMAYRDYLTGLPNQYAFQGHVEALVKGDRSFAILMIDLDRFKSVNDSWGHEVGDQLLKAVSERLLKYIPHNADLFRYGGDEYIISFESKSKGEIHHFVTMIQNLFKNSFIVNGIEISISSSIGVSLCPEDGSDIDTLLKKSDNALYFSKRHGRNHFTLYQDVADEIDNQLLKTELLLKNALQKEELFLAYQPQIDISDYSVYGVEALLRWENEEIGLVPPSHFIPIAEDSGLIIEIGKWVIETACRQLADWKDLRVRDVKMSVNVSTYQFYHIDFIPHLQETIRTTGIDPSQLVLEITESIASNAGTVIDQLKKLKEMKVKVSIDDFGTGYSSLKYLKDFPIDHLKIDKSFVQEIGEDEKSEDIVSSIITLARNLGFQTIAEGAETEQHIQFLKNQKCDLVQGYYFSKPLYSKTFKCWLSNWNI
ncbi:cyclic di-GMP phosphodiesterase Gmr [Andreesenia angusta]|uniref:Cyclic di-GMP phosphodiesterase Gmr n=1 Tax=Andreesenia angusta TaxID=39480 RepID=A0A1S1V9N3_9FIRM|nr:cyclic di-GMP phosphodiesterase Gmr [Andreesenia angusta]